MVSEHEQIEVEEPQSEIAVDEFFDGVNEARAYLERHQQGSEQRISRLSHLTRVLMRTRGARGLAQWLTTRIAVALGAESIRLWVNDERWRVWWRIGERRGEALESGGQFNGHPDRHPELLASTTIKDGEYYMPLQGSGGCIALVVISDCEEIDDESMSLLEALLATAAVMLEQALSIEKLARDSHTDLLSIAGLVTHGGHSLRQVPAPGHAVLVFAVRWHQFADTSDPTEILRRVQLARANLPPGTCLGGEGNDLYGAMSGVEIGRLDEGLTRFTRALEKADFSFSCAYRMAQHPIDDLRSFLDMLSARLEIISPGQLQRL